jgi:uracil phosphoribosyltransferase
MTSTCLFHPVAHDALTRLRDRNTQPSEFRAQMHRLSLMLAMKATRDLVTCPTEIFTPMAASTEPTLSGTHALIPIMRAGNGMLEAFLTLLPNALVWHMDMSRDHDSFDPIFTGSKVPEHISEEIETCFVLDPMLATGGSASFAIQYLKDRGANKIVFVGILGCTQGVRRLSEDHHDVSIYLGGKDKTLNDQAYIVPGLGDAGDRLYPTR